MTSQEAIGVMYGGLALGIAAGLFVAALIVIVGGVLHLVDRLGFDVDAPKEFGKGAP